MKNQTTTKKLALASILIAVSVVGGALAIPVFAAKCAPVQHLVNVMAAIILGPFYGVGMAFVTSLIRVLSGTGSLLAFPGSMCGALLAGLLYKYFKKEWFAYIGELVGTGIIGAMLAFPMTTLVMGKEAALFTYIIPFMISSLGGTVLAVVLNSALKATKIMPATIGGKR